MKSQQYQTSRGPIVIRGEAEPSSSRPLLFMIRGAFPNAAQLADLGGNFPDADFAWCDLPGMHSPFFAESSVAAFAAGIDEVLQTAFPERRVSILGLSIGGVVALHLKSSIVRSVLAIDPPLTTDGLWPMHRWLLSNPALLTGQLGDWVWNVFGVRPGQGWKRDYRAAIRGPRPPTEVLFASDSLQPVRRLERIPSLVGEGDRAAYLAQPSIRTTIVPGTGHDIPAAGLDAILAALRSSIESI